MEIHYFIQQRITEHLYLPDTMLGAGDIPMSKRIKTPSFGS